MKKTFAHKLAIEETQWSLKIIVSPAALKDWCLCLDLLEESMISELVVPYLSISNRIEIAKQYAIDSSSYQGNPLRVLLSERDLNYMRHFFMRYYRDGVADVDHIDIETDKGDYITLKVEESIAPMSAEEAKRKLGM
jgi:hypothetical protein